MASHRDHQSGTTTKLLFIGNSGSGKTGGLASLASAGYNLRIIDTDNGVDVLANILRDPKGGYPPEAIDRVEVETLTDPMKKAPSGVLIPSRPTVWNRAIKLLERWDTPTAKFGPLSEWGSQDVLVLDTLTGLCNAAMNFVLSMNGRLGQHPQQSDWGQAQGLVESLLQLLYDDGIKCNVIVNCHITYIGDDTGPQQGYPASLGKALSPKIGRYFNTMLMAKSVGQGAAAKQKILTRPTGGAAGLVELKNTAPLRVAVEYPIETGLADYFKAVRAPQAPTK